MVCTVQYDIAYDAHDIAILLTETPEMSMMEYHFFTKESLLKNIKFPCQRFSAQTLHILDIGCVYVTGRQGIHHGCLKLSTSIHV